MKTKSTWTTDYFTCAPNLKKAQANIKCYLKNIGYKYIKFTGMFTKNHPNHYWLRVTTS